MSANPYLDKDFLYDLDQQHNREIYARITSLTMSETPIEYIEGKVTGGSINIDGTSTVRRTCSLTMVANDVNINDYYWGVTTKFILEIGLKNNINDNYDDIIWFKEGIFIVTSFNTSLGTNNYTISINGKDKMCLLNGDISGSLPSSVDFGNLETYDTIYDEVKITDKTKYTAGTYYVEYDTDEGTDYKLSYDEYDENQTYYSIDYTTTETGIPIPKIIREAIHTYANEPYHNIIINDLDDYGLELMEYRGDSNLYYLYQDDIITNMTCYGTQACTCCNYNSKIKAIETLFTKNLIDVDVDYCIIDNSYAVTNLKQIIATLTSLYDNNKISKAEYIQYLEDIKDSFTIELTLEDIPSQNSYHLTDGNFDSSSTSALCVRFPGQPESTDELTLAYYQVVIVEYGDTAGYEATDLTYTGELVAAVGDSLTSVLDKIVTMLGDFEYFYDIDGRFIWQKKKTYVNTSWSSIVDSEDDDDYVMDSVYTSESVYSFEDNNLITAFQNTPNLTNLRNDFTVWGERETSSGAKSKVHMRYAIDNKPTYYKNFEGKEFFTQEFIDRFKVFKEAEIRKAILESVQSFTLSYADSMPSFLKKPSQNTDGSWTAGWWDIRDWFNYYKLLDNNAPLYTMKWYSSNDENGCQLVSDLNIDSSKYNCYNYDDYAKLGYSAWLCQVSNKADSADNKKKVYFSHGCDVYGGSYLCAKNQSYYSADSSTGYITKRIINVAKSTSDLKTGIYYFNSEEKCNSASETEYKYGRHYYWTNFEYTFYFNTQQEINTAISEDSISFPLYYMEQKYFAQPYATCDDDHTYLYFMWAYDVNLESGYSVYFYNPSFPNASSYDEEITTSVEQAVETYFKNRDYVVRDWRELIYQMQKDYYQHNEEEDFVSNVMLNNILEDYDDTGTLITTSKYPTGYTGYEQYYIDMQGFWRELYNPEVADEESSNYGLEYDTTGGSYQESKTWLTDSSGNYVQNDIVEYYFQKSKNTITATVKDSSSSSSATTTYIYETAPYYDENAIYFEKDSGDYYEVGTGLAIFGNNSKFEEWRNTGLISYYYVQDTSLYKDATFYNNKVVYYTKASDGTYSRAGLGQDIFGNEQVFNETIKTTAYYLKDYSKPVILSASKSAVFIKATTYVASLLYYIDTDGVKSVAGTGAMLFGSSAAFQTNQEAKDATTYYVVEKDEDTSVTSKTEYYYILATYYDAKETYYKKVDGVPQAVGLGAKVFGSEEQFKKSQLQGDYAYTTATTWVPSRKIALTCDYFLPEDTYSYIYDGIKTDITNAESYELSQLDKNNVAYEDNRLKVQMQWEETLNELSASNTETLVNDEELYYWNKNVALNPSVLRFWIDFLDASESDLSKYSVPVVGDRAKAVNDNDVTAIYFRETPNIIFTSADDYDPLDTKSGYTYAFIDKALSNLFTLSSQGKSAKDQIDSMLYSYTYCTEKVSITAIPVYYLQPNTRITIHDENSKINGEYIINTISLPLAYNGTMSISATKAVNRIY